MAPAAVISLSEGRRAGGALRMLSDRHLSRLAKKGDPRAFAAIYERHHQDIYRYCRSITGNNEDASDALQSTMAAALRSLPGERREISLRPWLFKVAHNESVSLIRRRRPAAELREDSESAAPGPYRLACMRERVTGLVESLRDLPERQRGALVMRELNGLDYGEIGTALGISGPAARQAVYEARLALTELDQGRQMDCDVVRRSISARDGRIMRGRRLRAHLRGCRSCASFSEQVEVRRSALSSVFPPLPAAAGAAIFGAIFGGGSSACIGTGASVGGGVISLMGGAFSQAAGAGATKGAAAVVAVAVAGVGGVEIAKETTSRSSPPAAVRPASPHGNASDAAARLRAHAKSAARRRQSARARVPAARDPRLPSARERDQARERVSSPAPARPRKPRVPVTENVSVPQADPVKAPTPGPQAPTAAPTAPEPSAPTLPQYVQQQYDEGMTAYREGMALVERTMQGVQQMMNGLFSGTQR